MLELPERTGRQQGSQSLTAPLSRARVSDLPQDASAPLIEVSALCKRYPGTSAPAVDALSFTVREGEVFGLLGPNGAGKTTAISMLAGLIAPTSGSARIAGYDIVAGARFVKRLIGLVPQDLALYPTLSVRDNLAFFGGLYGLRGGRLQIRIAQVLETVGLAKRASQPVETLSGGMKRRVNIAAGLLHEPKVLFLDEPTVGVDPQSRAFIFEKIESLKQERLTVIYTTHYMEEAERLCDRLAIIDRGRLITLGEPKRLIEDHGGIIVIAVAGDDMVPLASITSIPGVADVTQIGNRLKVKAAHPARTLAPVINALSRAGREIRSVEILEHNLESVFLDLTGRPLRD